MMTTGMVIYKNCINFFLHINLKGKDLSHLPLANEEKHANILYDSGNHFETRIAPFKMLIIDKVSLLFSAPFW